MDHARCGWRRGRCGTSAGAGCATNGVFRTAGIVLAGFTTLAAYGLVLLAMAGGMPASYAGAIREVSVVLGAAYGVLVLKEQGGPMRMVGAGLVAAGVAAIGLLG